ncbi:uncharacterized protein TRIADDRAFT_28473 [Trichoplax adhaerens]|uniref:Inosine/uridine-preferring nucleoside hydrolase domain-containing protein n=1 Tax=Trichoplax adhaerens TaxID=10228 RepID=B3S4I2_TRIAD|nr:hypothetical protein TRIADDRAFT_28473 [Trichoplax adhaerens]EDV22637.1 hypothetical protein TRIADDRAFT_28473 [Trichoplax adhaerens]|eukprot:XP_002115181.1 hypothetical protein TRIADDRAFT_28473 [Trichoplax adhaerens]
MRCFGNLLSKRVVSRYCNVQQTLSTLAHAKYSNIAENKQSENLLLMDVDCGIDDANAIILALSAFRTSKLLGITCVNGNIRVDQVVKNVAYVLEICERDDIPVFAGADHPLVTQHVHAPPFHGTDGLGDIKKRNDNPEWKDKVLREDHAVHAMINLINQNRNKVSLIMIGPLTNLALACRLDPTFPSKVKDLTIMGGNYQGKGNITTAAEFNFYADPEAANVVLETFPDVCTTRIVPWESALASYLPWDWVTKKWFCQGTKKSQFTRNILANVLDNWRNESPKGYTSSDAVAVATVLDPTIVKDYVEVAASVETDGRLTKGQVVIDWDNRSNRSLIQVITQINLKKFKEMMWNSTL